MEQREYKKLAMIDQKYWWFIAKKMYIASFLQSFTKKIKNPTILDVGCGTGGITIFLKKFGKVQAIEQNIFASRIAKKRNILVITANANKLPFAAASFSIVTCLDVLYHKKINIQKIFLELARVLEPHGNILITDSALPHLWSHHDTAMHARQRFMLDEMCALLEENGFVIKHKTYIFFLVYPFVFLARKIFSQSTDSDSVVPQLPKIVENSLLALCKLEAKIIPHIPLPIGSSLLVVAQKK